MTSGPHDGDGPQGRDQHPPVHSDIWVPPEQLNRPAADRPAAEVPAAAAAGAGAAGGTAVLDQSPPAAPAGRHGSTDRRRSERRLAYWLVAPAAVVMALVTGYPIVYAIWLSLTDANLRDPGEQKFVGLSNYGTVLSSNYWWTALAVTVCITVVSVLIELVLGMAIAMVMHRAMFGKGLVRTVVLIPYGIVTVAAAISWKYAWTPGTGYLANLLPDGSAPLTEQIPALSIVVLAEVWKTTPFMALLLLAGLALVPDDLLKAAQVDGAGAWTRLFRITLPLMKPAILVALLFRTLDAFRIFDNIYVLTAGNHDTGSVSMLGYNNLFKAFNLGVGSAISILIFLCVAIIAGIFIKGFGASAPGSDDEGR
ncbi:carbohydrate ABC transporter permease [Gordonia sp. VNK21]|uniref:carbohydrate ABC transporter permease n=1 Tax=Gordonia sp. VNK21 TaxID=3382483 RepID=UPI0038D487EB